MPIYYLETPHYSFNERHLPNGKYRYTGYTHTIEYCVDCETRKTEDEINEFLESCSVEFLVHHEGYIINIQ